MTDDKHYLKEWRQHAGLTQRDIAKALGITDAHVSRFETGARAWKRRHLQQIKNAINAALARRGSRRRIEHVSELLSCDPRDPLSQLKNGMANTRLWSTMIAAFRAELQAVER